MDSHWSDASLTTSPDNATLTLDTRFKMSEFFELVVGAAVLWFIYKWWRRSKGGDMGRGGAGSRSRRTDRDDHFEIGDEFFVDTARSPNGRYLAGARDEGWSGDRRVRGACALLDTRKSSVCFVRKLQRGNNPHVGNDGLMIVEDWKTANLSGALLAFDRNGTRLWSRHFKANLYDSGLSEDSTLAFVCTANSDYEPHSGKTILFDARSGKVIWKRDGWDNASFSGNQLVVELEWPDRRKKLFALGPRGELPDKYHAAKEAISEEQSRGKYWGVIPKVTKALACKPPDFDEAEKALAELTDPAEKIPPNSRAKLLRYSGEVAEAKGDMEAALRFWKQALELDSKVGIKRRYEALIAKSLAQE